MSKSSAAKRRQATRNIFEAEYFATKDYRTASRRAGISERTGRRWRAELGEIPHQEPSRSTPHSVGAIGRHLELEDIRQRLRAGSRLVTVIGPPGVGKTRLALFGMPAFSADVQASEPTVFCDLRRVTTTTDFATQLAEGLGIHLAEGIETVRNILGHVLRARSPIVLILDNFECVAAEAAVWVSEWLKQAPALRVVVTSRRMLRIEGEELIELGPLSLPAASEETPDKAWSAESMRLFLQRAQAVEPALTRSALPVEEVARLVRQLEGIPLAIELAAAQTRRASPGELVRDLSGRLLSLKNPLRDADPFHATLASAIERSWLLLSKRERSTLARISVFHQGFSTDAAVAAAGVNDSERDQILSDLVVLRECSLIRVTRSQTGERRWDVYEAIREYAETQLESSEDADRVKYRTAKFFLERAERWAAALRAHDSLTARLRLTDDLENLRGSFRHLTRLGSSDELARMALALHGAYVDWLPQAGIDYVNEALDRTQSSTGGASRLRSLLLLARVGTERTLGNYRAAEAGLDALDEMLKEPTGGYARNPLPARVAYERGMLDLYRGRMAESREQLTHALSLVERLDDPRLEGQIRSGLAWVLAEGFRSTEAFVHHPKAVALMQTVGDVFGESAARRIWAIHRQFFHLGDPGDDFQRAAKSADALQGKYQFAWAVSARSSYHLDQGRCEEAEADARSALSVAKRTGLRRLVGIALGQLAHALDERKASHDAVLAAEEALSVFSTTLDVRFEALLRMQLAGLHAREDRLDHARHLLNRAATLLERSGDHRLQELIDLQQSQIDLGLAREAFRQGNIGRGLDEQQRAASRADSAQTPKQNGEVLPISACSIEARHFLRMLERQIEWDRQTWALRISPGGHRFSLGTSPFVTVGVGGVVPGVLRALAEHREAAPGTPMQIEHLLEQVWPNERMRREAGVQRVRDTVKRLRRLGLTGAVVSSDRGYLIHPGLRVALDRA